MSERAIDIRRAMEDDAAAVRGIVQRAYEGYVDSIGVRPAPMDADHEAAVRAGTVFVADAAGVVGVIVLALEADHVLVENVAVDPRAQHRGIGRRLLAFADDYARENARRSLRLFTHRRMERNLRLYDALGYEREPPPPGDRSQRVFLVRRLEP